MVAQTASLDPALEILVQRLRPIIINAARGYLRILSWTIDDAMQEARILLWSLITHKRYRDGVPFHNFFAKCFSNRLNKLYRDYLLKNPAPAGDVMIGWEAHQPLVVGVVGFKEEYIEKYRAAQSERNRRLYDKRLEAEGKTRKPTLSEAEKAVRKAEARKRTAERALSWQRENRKEYNARRAEIRREKKAGTFVDRRRKAVCATTV